MGFASKFNKTAKFTYDVSSFDSYYSLKMLGASEHVFPVHALYMNTKGEYGPHPLVACNGYFVSLPAHMNDVVNEILNDVEAIESINKGLVGFTIYSYKTNKTKNECYSINWVDLDNEWEEEVVKLPEATKSKKGAVVNGEEIDVVDVE